MHEDLIQKISQFLDDELPEEESLRLLQKMRTHSELAGKMRRYEAIKQAIKNDEGHVQVVRKNNLNVQKVL